MEDFTFEEPKLIKSWAGKATTKNSKEPNRSTVIWRVRGSAKKVAVPQEVRKDATLTDEMMCKNGAKTDNQDIISRRVLNQILKNSMI